jgi:hypothetical protein
MSDRQPITTISLLSVRQQFALGAMQALLGNHKYLLSIADHHDNEDDFNETIAEDVVGAVDAVLAALGD